MSRRLKELTSIIIIFFSITVLTAGNAKAQVGVSVSFQTFYDDLSPYGEWVNDGAYGYVWVPDVDAGFRPYYTRGHWVMTEYGNTWVSDYPWGWAPFHYGRWVYDDYYGWVWVPGSDWAPAWVSWRYSNDYCGWAPLGPGISIGISFSSYNCPDDWWVFVGPRYLYRPDYYHYWRGPSYNRVIINRTTIVNNVYVYNGNHVRYNYGPRASMIQQATHQPVPMYRVANMSRPGAPVINHNVVSIYHPSVVRKMAGARPAPSRVIAAPRPLSRAMQPAVARTPVFRSQLKQGIVRPGMTARPAPNMQRRIMARPENAQHNNPAPPARPAPMQRNIGHNMPQQYNMQHFNRQQPAPQHFERPQPAPQQHFERSQPPMQRQVPVPQHFQRPQPVPQQHFEQPQHFQRPQPVPQQHFERPQPPMQHSQPMPHMEAPRPMGPPPVREEHGRR